MSHYLNTSARLRLRTVGFIAVGFLLAASADAAEHPALARARALYNVGDFEGAITYANLSRQEPSSADASALVVARALLERYRAIGDSSDLASARAVFSTVRTAALSPRDQVDLQIGLGQSLYLAEAFGSAAEIFDTALGRSAVLGARDRQRLLDWWATAFEREAQTRSPEIRTRMFEHIARRMEEELRQDPANAPANYWLAVSMRGAGDVERAWDVAIAGWVRARLDPDTTDSLRADLDRLVTERIIPAQARAHPPAEQEALATARQIEWMLVKEQWK